MRSIAPLVEMLWNSTAAHGQKHQHRNALSIIILYSASKTM